MEPQPGFVGTFGIFDNNGHWAEAFPIHKGARREGVPGGWLATRAKAMEEIKAAFQRYGVAKANEAKRWNHIV